jgi:hypothetical protein
MCPAQTRPTEERESSASEDNGDNREPLPSAVTSQQQQHIAPAPPNQATRKPAPIFRLPPKEVPEPVGPSLKVNMPEFTKRTLSGAMQRHFVRAIAQQDTESARMYLEHEGTAHLDCLTPDALLAMHSCTVRVPEPLVRVPVPFVPVLVPVRGTAGTAGWRGGWRVPRFYRLIFTADIQII